MISWMDSKLKKLTEFKYLDSILCNYRDKSSTKKESDSNISAHDERNDSECGSK